MKNFQTLLAHSLFAGAGYFFAVSIAHLLELKIPGLFVFFDVESFEYQNKIISMLAFGWAAFFYLGAELVKKGFLQYIKLHLIAGLAGILILTYTHTTQELAELTNESSLIAHWLITVALCIYLLLLLVLYLKAVKEDNS